MRGMRLLDVIRAGRWLQHATFWCGATAHVACSCTLHGVSSTLLPCYRPPEQPPLCPCLFPLHCWLQTGFFQSCRLICRPSQLCFQKVWLLQHVCQRCEVRSKSLFVYGSFRRDMGGAHSHSQKHRANLSSLFGGSRLGRKPLTACLLNA